MLDPEIEGLITRALAEDIGLRDLTAEAVVEPGRRARAQIEQKQPGVIYGLEVASAVFRRLDPLINCRPLTLEGEWRKEVPATVVELEGDARALLSGERVALNFLQHLSGVATLTATYVYALRGTGVKVLDTRKTTPGLRLLEKRAVVAGGGRNHRMGLYDAMLVKDNHIALAGSVGEATRRALARRPPGCAVQVECRTVAEVEEALAEGAEALLLDNMEPAELGRAVELVAGRVTLEASGGITPQSIQGIAGSGLQFVSVGALTHSAPALDLSMKLEPL
jgi:nicotinate-nucleotide pyrophosphorylase (carboxylating)